MNNASTTRRQAGVTLMELLIVVVIIGIIAAIAYPSYTQFIVKAKRGAAQSMILQVADRQQQYFMDNKRYAAALTDLNYTSDPIVIGDEGQFLAAGHADSIYSIELANLTATTYTIEATPLLEQAKRDTTCGTLAITHTGVKSPATGKNCW